MLIDTLFIDNNSISLRFECPLDSLFMEVFTTVNKPISNKLLGILAKNLEITNTILQTTDNTLFNLAYIEFKYILVKAGKWKY